MMRMAMGGRPRLATLVSYCSLERAYIHAIVRNALLFSDVVVVSVGTRLYSGEQEPGRDDVERDVLRGLQGVHDHGDRADDVRIVWYDVPEHVAAPIEMHNRAREVGVAEARRALPGADFWTLLLDGDEIPDGPSFARWWSSAGPLLSPDLVYKMANYWFFLHPLLVADVHEDSVLLVHASQLTAAALRHPRERDGVYMERGLRALRGVAGLDGAPMFSHMSWVRESRAALVAKVKNWGHARDRPWAALIHDALDGIEAGRMPERDFVHGYPLRMLAREPWSGCVCA